MYMSTSVYMHICKSGCRWAFVYAGLGTARLKPFGGDQRAFGKGPLAPGRA